ncbi:uncharacterized protein LOC103793582 [Callithrix jacchus]
MLPGGGLQLLRPVADTGGWEGQGRAGRRRPRPEEGAAQTEPGGGRRAGVVGACGLRLAVWGRGDVARREESPGGPGQWPGRGTQPTCAAPDGLSPRARAPLCLACYARALLLPRPGEASGALGPFQAQQRPRADPLSLPPPPPEAENPAAAAKQAAIVPEYVWTVLDTSRHARMRVNMLCREEMGS